MENVSKIYSDCPIKLSAQLYAERAERVEKIREDMERIAKIPPHNPRKYFSRQPAKYVCEFSYSLATYWDMSVRVWLDEDNNPCDLEITLPDGDIVMSVPDVYVPSEAFAGFGETTPILLDEYLIEYAQSQPVGVDGGRELI